MTIIRKFNFEFNYIYESSFSQFFFRKKERQKEKLTTNY